MKKLLILVLSLTFILTFAACGDEIVEETEGSDDVISGVPNPMVEVSSLEELAEKGNFKISHIENATDEMYFTYNIDPLMYEYQFTLNGLDGTVRYSTEKENDISGLYITGEGTAFQNSTEDNAYIDAQGYKALRWFSDDGQYILTINDNGQMTKEEFEKIANQIK